VELPERAPEPTVLAPATPRRSFIRRTARRAAVLVLFTAGLLASGRTMGSEPAAFAPDLVPAVAREAVPTPKPNPKPKPPVPKPAAGTPKPRPAPAPAAVAAPVVRPAYHAPAPRPVVPSPHAADHERPSSSYTSSGDNASGSSASSSDPGGRP